MEIDDLIIGEDELEYLFNSSEIENFNNLENNLEQDLFRISKAIKGLKLYSNCKYVINAKQNNNIYLNKITFLTSEFKNEIIYSKKVFGFTDKSRCIKFHLQNKKIKIRFIIDSFYLEKILNEFNSPSFTVSNGRNSNISINDINSVFDDINIVEIYCEKKSNIMTIKNFNERIKKMTIIEDISLNSEIYFKDSFKNKINFISEYDYYYNQILFFLLNKNKNTMLFLGPKNCSKSIFLNLITKFLILREWGRFYINMKYIKEINDKLKIKKILYKEFLYSILDENDIDTIYNWRIFDRIAINNNTNFVLNLIKVFINLYENCINKKIVVIIDNFIIENENEQKDLEDIIYFMNTKNIWKYKLIVSGDGKLFREKLKYYFLEDSNKLKFEEVIFMNIKNIPKFNNMNINLENEFLLQEKLYLDKFNFHSLFYCLNYDQKTLNIEEFKNCIFFETFPNYLNISKENELIKFNIISDVYTKALNEKIEFNIKKDTLKFIMKKNFFPRTGYGIAEELLIILLLKYNKFNVQNMNFKEKNFIEIEEINKIKDFMQINYSYHLNNNENLLITQKNYYGQNYDLLIIQKIDNKINAIFVQIGLDKTKTEIKKIKTDLVENINEYKKGLKAFGFNVDNFYLLFIFDEETQRNLYNKNSGTKICFNNKIDFLVYSFQDFCLKSTINLTDYNKLLYFIPKYEIKENSSCDLK